MRFKYKDLAKAFFKENGFVVFEDVLTDEDIANFLKAYDECIKEGKIKWKEEVAYESINDAIFLHPTFEKYVKDKRLVNIAETLLGTEIELQHSKINDKPRLKKEGETKEAVEWHQDFPFFPHTNFDMLAPTIHFDDEDEGSGALKMIPGSHKSQFSHVKNGEFIYKCSEEIPTEKAVTLTGKKGMITAHHGLTLHASAPRNKGEHRRTMVYQYRARDAIQIAGVIWKCYGYQVKEYKTPRMARLEGGIKFEMRGDKGRLFDIYGKLAPDK